MAAKRRKRRKKIELLLFVSSAGFAADLSARDPRNAESPIRKWRSTASMTEGNFTQRSQRSQSAEANGFRAGGSPSCSSPVTRHPTAESVTAEDPRITTRKDKKME